VEFREVVEGISLAVELTGVAVILLGAVAVTGVFARSFVRRGDVMAAYREYRHGLGRTILLGLEFLIAGDIIRTVAVERTFDSLGVLAALIGIRAVLSFTLETELTGRWPWQRGQDEP
jgi:uncharacterized membrane protein